GEEQPDPELPVGDPGDRMRLDGVRNQGVGGVRGQGQASRANCGWKSLLRPGSLYSYGSRSTTGGVTKLPCGGGEGAGHSSVLACHGFSAALGWRRLPKKFQMNGSCAIARARTAHDTTTSRL